MGEQESAVLEGQEQVQDEDADEAVELVAAGPGVADTESARVNLNTASEEELQQLPGIGAVLAGRIVDHRTEAGPFRNAAEVTAVSGVSTVTYAGLEDRVSASFGEPQLDSATAPAYPEAEMPGESELETETPVEEAEDLIEPGPGAAQAEVEEKEEPESVPVLVREPLGDEVGLAEELEPEPDSDYVAEAPPRGPEPPLVEVVQARYGCARLLLVGVLSTILGALLALLFLFLVNGTLDFQSAAIRAAQDEVLRMEGVVGALDRKVAELEEGIAAIQELEARLSDTQATLGDVSADLSELKQRFELLAETQDAVRQEFTNMREDMDGLAVQVSVLDGRLSDVETQVAFLDRKIEILGESIQRFDAFLIGLGALLNEIQGDLPPTPTPWITPLPTATAPPTPILRPQVTVTPLATSTPPPP